MPPETGLSAPLGDTHARMCVHCKIYARAACVDALVQKRPELIAVIRRRVYRTRVAIGNGNWEMTQWPGGGADL